MPYPVATRARARTESHVENPRFLRKAEDRLKDAQRIVSHLKKGSNRRRKAVRVLARKHRKVARARRDHHFKTAKDLVVNYDVSAAENLNVKGMAQGNLAKSVHDAGWGQFLDILEAKATSLGREVIRVDPRNTSQDCSGCGHRPEEKKTLDVRTHHCVKCGLILDRDVNAARNILQRAELKMAEDDGLVLDAA